MTIAVGNKIPNVTLKVMGENGPQEVATESLFAGKKVVLFAVPGAFTPTCSAAHLPGFVVKADGTLKQKHTAFHRASKCRKLREDARITMQNKNQPH